MTKSYAEFLDLLSDQTEAIHGLACSGDWEGLLGALEERQVLIDQIDALPLEATEMEPEALKTVTRILERLETEHGQILVKLQAAAVSVREDLEASDRARATVAAYGRSSSAATQIPMARFVDKQK